MRSSLLRGTAPLLVVVGVLFAPTLAMGAGPGHHARNARIRHGESNNWSGYALSGAGPYSSVSASWTQPAVDCAKSRNAYSAFWIGLDGDTTETVEQTGTEADCAAGKATYGAWYEMYPKDSFPLSEPVSPGDHLTASVTYLGKAFFGLTEKFSLALSDTTQGWSRTVTKFLRGAQLGSAEAIAEAPSSLLEILPLSDFGTVGFTGMTVDGSLVNGSTPGVEPLTMVSEKGAVEAQPSAISEGSFSDTWFSE